jgi:hypothetical protein
MLHTEDPLFTIQELYTQRSAIVSAVLASCIGGYFSIVLKNPVVEFLATVAAGTGVTIIAFNIFVRFLELDFLAAFSLALGVVIISFCLRSAVLHQLGMNREVR